MIFCQSSNPIIKVFVFFPKEEKMYTYPHMYTENDCNLAMKSSFFSPNSSKMPPSAVKNKAIFASLVRLTAGFAGNCGDRDWGWVAQWAACVWLFCWLPLCRCDLFLAKASGSVSKWLCSVLLWLGTWRLGGEMLFFLPRPWHMQLQKGWVNKGLAKCLCSLEKCHCCHRSVGDVILVSCSGCRSLYWQRSHVPQVWLQLLVFNLNACLLQDRPAWGWLCWCTPCWAKHSPVKVPQRSAGQHLQNRLFSKIIFSVSQSKRGNADHRLKQSLGFCWDSSTGHRLHENVLACLGREEELWPKWRWCDPQHCWIFCMDSCKASSAITKEKLI